MVLSSWQDYVFAGGQMLFAIALTPSLVSKNKPSKWTSLTTSIMLMVFGYTYWSLNMTYSSTAAIIAAIIWAVLYVQKIRE